MKSNFSKRALTGAVFVVALLGLTWLNFYSFAGLFLVASIIGTFEFYKLFKKSDLKPNILGGTLLSIVVYIGLLSNHFDLIDFNLSLLSIPIAVFILIQELAKGSKTPFQNIAISIFGPLYVSLPFALLVLSNYNDVNYEGDHQFYIAFSFYFMLWANDTGAYLVGRKFGKTKLFERISPNKTWEGTFGGAIVATLVAFISYSYFGELSLLQWIIFALIIVIFGSLGDLVESMLKRSLNVKDSGKILPGHGGILDRFDGLLLAAPMIYFFLQLI